MDRVLHYFESYNSMWGPVWPVFTIHLLMYISGELLYLPSSISIASAWISNSYFVSSCQAVFNGIFSYLSIYPEIHLKTVWSELIMFNLGSSHNRVLGSKLRHWVGKGQPPHRSSETFFGQQQIGKNHRCCDRLDDVAQVLGLPWYSLSMI